MQEIRDRQEEKGPGQKANKGDDEKDRQKEMKVDCVTVLISSTLVL